MPRYWRQQAGQELHGKFVSRIWPSPKHNLDAMLFEIHRRTTVAPCHLSHQVTPRPTCYLFVCRLKKYVAVPACCHPRIFSVSSTFNLPIPSTVNFHVTISQTWVSTSILSFIKHHAVSLSTYAQFLLINCCNIIIYSCQ